MKHRSKDKEIAIELRKQGLSYKEIQGHVFVSKGLLSLWLSRLELTKEESERLHIHNQERIQRGKVATLIANRTRRIERERILIKDAEKLFTKFKKNPLFFAGLSLYWSGGVKHGYAFDFSTKDHEMMHCMLLWVKTFLGVDKRDFHFRVTIDNRQGREAVSTFWSKKLDTEPSFFVFTVVKPSKEGLKKAKVDMGCVRLSIYGVDYLRRVNAWQKLLIQYYDEASILYP